MSGLGRNCSHLLLCYEFLHTVLFLRTIERSRNSTRFLTGRCSDSYHWGRQCTDHFQGHRLWQEGYGLNHAHVGPAQRVYASPKLAKGACSRPSRFTLLQCLRLWNEKLLHLWTYQFVINFFHVSAMTSPAAPYETFRVVLKMIIFFFLPGSNKVKIAPGRITIWQRLTELGNSISNSINAVVWWS